MDKGPNPFVEAMKGASYACDPIKKQVIGIAETSPNVWRLTFDGRVLGDSRGYSKREAQNEANSWVARHPDYYELAKAETSA